MKKISILCLLFAIFLFSCDKNNDNTWSEKDQAYYQNVIALQDEAAVNYESWLQSMDSTEAILQLREFFLADSTVVSAEISRQGIAVQYSNGMRGGIFINPDDEFETDSLIAASGKMLADGGRNEKSLVNNKKAIFLNPSYWERSAQADAVIASYQADLPKVGFVLQDIYKGEQASVDRFTQLKGYGLIHVYTHGYPWFNGENVVEVYLKTGERANSNTSWKYWDEILKGNIILNESEVAANTWASVYYITEKFLAEHNDFSKDTTLFYGGFCYSFLGTWPQLSDNFASGDYFGFNWRVKTSWNCNLAKSLIGNMTDTTTVPVTSLMWMNNPDPSKQRWDSEDQKFCQVWCSGDPDLVLWRPPAKVLTSEVTNIEMNSATCGGNVLADGGFPITARGVCWSTNPEPTVNDAHTTDGSGIGVFTSNLTGLNGDTPYYVRAYAINSKETLYGNQKSFTTTGGDLYIGKPYQGGKIFYLDGEHGLIADTMNHALDPLYWGCMGVLISSTSAEIGSGFQNTEAIVNGCSEDTPARYCYNMDWYGYTDWFLPSKDELNEIYLQKSVLGSFFSYGTYFSSTEYDEENIWVQEFSGGYPGQQYTVTKYASGNFFRVRAF